MHRTMRQANGIQIELAGISKAYGEQVVLDGIDLAIADAEFLAVMGRSGSGKSTLLKIVGGLDTPDAGAVIHRGRNLNGMSERERTRFRRSSLGFVFQFFNLIPTLTVRENVCLPLDLNGMAADESKRRSSEVLAELEIDGCADRFPEELSGGEQQRAAIARALVHEPELVIADEPTGNLDLETAGSVLGVLGTSCRQRGTTLIVATHSREIASVADRTLRILGARLEEAAP